VSGCYLFFQGSRKIGVCYFWNEQFIIPSNPRLFCGGTFENNVVFLHIEIPVLTRGLKGDK